MLPDPGWFDTPDSVEYDRLARNLLAHGVFSSEDAPPWRPDAFRTPGYPVLMAVVYGLAGHVPAAAVALQLVLGSVTAGLVGVLGLRLGLSPRAASLAALAVAVDPVSVLLANQLLTETLFTLLLAAGLAGLARYWERGGIGWLGASGLALGLATLTRPLLLFVLPLLTPLFAVADRRTPWRAWLTRGVPFVLLPLLLITAWAARNYREAGVFTPSAVGTGMLFRDLGALRSRRGRGRDTGGGAGPPRVGGGRARGGSRAARAAGLPARDGPRDPRQSPRPHAHGS